MSKLVELWQSLFAPEPLAPELVRAKAYELWKAQGGGTSDPDANWQAAIAQIQLERRLSRRNFLLEVARIIITSLSTTATIFGGFILFLNFSQGENRLITERFTRSIEQLGNKEETIRIGGIYALERIAKDSPKDRWTIMEVLSSFVRGKQAIRSAENNDKLPAISNDSQAALTAIARRNIDREAVDRTLNLSSTNLSSANLNVANLDRVNLNDSILIRAEIRAARLNDANLSHANLQEANLTDTKLDRANLIQTNLHNANLSSASLVEANLNKADLSDAILDGSILVNASLGNTNLTSAILIGANLRGATLSRANLTKADLSGADLFDINLADANLNKTDLRKTKNLSIDRLKQAQNWQLAIYDPSFQDLLGIKPPSKQGG